MRTFRWPFLAGAGLALLAAVVACQGTAPPQIHAFTADPPVVAPGGAATLRWTVTGGGTLVVEPGVGDVTGAASTVVHPVTSTTYTLTATNAGGSDGAEVTVTVDASVDVAGTVLGLDGRPAPGVLVAIDGAGSDATGADGRFTIDDVEVPYVAHVLHPSAPLAVSYVDLTLTDPVLLVSGAPTAAAHAASVYGAASAGTGFPQPAAHLTRVALASPATRATVDADGATGGFEMVGVPWYGADAPAALHALQWRLDAGGLPVEYVGHGSRPLTLQAAIVGYLGQDMALLPVAEASVAGTVELPSGYVLGARTASVVFAEGGWITVLNEPSPPADFTYVTPLVPDATVAIAALASAPGGELTFAVRAGLPTAASGVAVKVDPVPHLLEPPDGAAAVGYGTDFAWDAPAGGVAVVLFTGAGTAPDYAVVTDLDHARVPDLRELGLDLPAAAAYTWQVVGLARYADVDAAASDEDGFLSSWWLNPFYLPHRDGSFAPSTQRSATIAP
jgi:hypothetical protein